MSKKTQRVVAIEIAEPSVVERIRPPKDEKGRYKSVDLSMEEIEARGFKTKAAQIRWLHSEGYSPSAIAGFMGVIYQHVRNTLKQQPKRVPKPVEKEE